VPKWIQFVMYGRGSKPDRFAVGKWLRQQRQFGLVRKEVILGVLWVATPPIKHPKISYPKLTLNYSVTDESKPATEGIITPWDKISPNA